jgi:hypothetical protein
MTLFKNIIMALALVIGFTVVGVVSSGATHSVLAQADEVCKGVNLNGSGTCDDGGKVTDIMRVVLNILSWVAGIIALIMIIIGGIKFGLSGGDSNKISSARGSIVYAIVGIVIVALAQVIVRFVLAKVKT